ncbi:MAG: sulfotransferase family protein [Rhizobiaceae bacterium]
MNLEEYPALTIKVIGAGFGRTGTDSMREALTILGFGPCHHMKAVMSDEDNRQMWRAVSQGADPDWDKILRGFTSCIDWPSAYYWRELAEYYPEARVILTNRSAESWWKSFQNTILKSIENSKDRSSLGVALVAEQVFDGNPGDRVNAIAKFEANVQSVIHTIPEDRLLIHNLGDGWEPVCEHLGVPVPNQDYPGLNSTAEYGKYVKKL